MRTFSTASHPINTQHQFTLDNTAETDFLPEQIIFVLKWLGYAVDFAILVLS